MAHYPLCTRCGSDDVLPFEDESAGEEDSLVFLILLAVVLLFMAYVFFLISTYILFPLSVFVGIIVITRAINKRYNTPKKRKLHRLRNYVCLECGGFFKA